MIQKQAGPQAISGWQEFAQPSANEGGAHGL